MLSEDPRNEQGWLLLKIRSMKADVFHARNQPSWKKLTGFKNADLVGSTAHRYVFKFHGGFFLVLVCLLCVPRMVSTKKNIATGERDSMAGRNPTLTAKVSSYWVIAAIMFTAFGQFCPKSRKEREKKIARKQKLQSEASAT